jgi:predicted phosphohydrolase
MVRIVAISDTHTYHDLLVMPPGDILVVAGDFTSTGTVQEVMAFNEWLGKLSYLHKIVVGGNHDWLFQNNSGLARDLLSNAYYLQDSEVTVMGLRFYGSPWQPDFCDWAFNKARGQELQYVWDKIPSPLDVLITHGPPHNILDEVAPYDDVGDEELLFAVRRVKPRLHIFGHVHEAHGRLEKDGTIFVNVSVLDGAYHMTWQPTVIDL